MKKYIISGNLPRFLYNNTDEFVRVIIVGETEVVLRPQQVKELDFVLSNESVLDIVWEKLSKKREII